MTKDRYRLSDLGVLLYFDKRWIPVECPIYQHFCTEECADFILKGNTATLKCEQEVADDGSKHDVVIELEE